MTEILTESFCERCGTRYTFESARPRVRLKGVKVLSRGLKNFVLSDDTSIDEAMAAARNEADREATTHQLDAFHKTFNFCLSCRQYTCPNCWNGAAARCLSCAPLALTGAPAAIDGLVTFRDGLISSEPSPANGAAEHVYDNWPTLSGVAADGEGPKVADGVPPLDPWTRAQPLPAAKPDVEPIAAELEVEAVVAAELEVEAVVAAEPEVEAVVARDTAEKAATQTADLLERFRPGQNLDAELEAYEREHRDDALDDERAAEPQTVQAEPIAVFASQPEPPAADLATSREPEIVAPPIVEAEAAPAALEAAALAREPAVEAAALTQVETPRPEAQPLAVTTSADVVEQPTWPVTAPDTTGSTPRTPSSERVEPVPLRAGPTAAKRATAEPQWPARAQSPGSATNVGLPFGRSAAPQGGIEALWAASNQELVAAPPPPGRTSNGIQPCVSCGLSLSANARFCRRCGTLQSH